MNRKTINNFESLVVDAIEVAKNNIDDIDKFNETIKSVNESMKTLKEVTKNDKFWDKETIIEVLKIAKDIITLIISLIGTYKFAKIVVNFEQDGVWTTSMGKGLTGLFKFKSLL